MQILSERSVIKQPTPGVIIFFDYNLCHSEVEGLKVLKKIKLISFAVLLLCCFSCVATTNDPVINPYGTKIHLIENQANAEVGYISYSSLLQELNEKSRVQMWSPSKLKLEKSYLPKGGKVIIRIWGTTIDSANTEWWEYVIQDVKGNLIKREKGDDGIDGLPEYTVSHRGTKWWNIDTVYIDQELFKPFKVFVIDRLSNKRSVFLVNP
jgi:hypothetical protein